MKGIGIIIKNEWLNFIRSDRGVFLVYGILIAVWSIVLASNLHRSAFETNTLWWIFFSVIVSGTFSNTTFVSERLSGALEIVLTCGLSRAAILAGKVVFIICMSVLFGLLCYGCALAEAAMTRFVPTAGMTAGDAAALVALYLAACYMNAACGAWLSIRLGNPRLSHFANLLVLGLIVGTHALLAAFVLIPAWALPAALVCMGTLFMLFALRDFASERVVQPYAF